VIFLDSLSLREYISFSLSVASPEKGVMKIIHVSESTVYLITFGSGKIWHPALQRLNKQAIRSKRFGKIISYSEKDLDFELTGIDPEFFKLNQRGYGLWIWKPIIIKHMLSQYPKCELVFYVDAGCEINSSKKALEKLDSYIETAKKQHGIAFELPFIEENWTSSYVIEEMKAANLRLTKQLAGGIFFLKNSASTHLFLDSWIDWMKKNNFSCLKGGGANYKEIHNFREHRFDQSIFSILWKKNNFKILPDQSFWAPNWRNDGKNYPIWSTRNKLRFSFASNRFFLFIYRVLRLILNVISKGKIII
jgi:hypothetical protein